MLRCFHYNGLKPIQPSLPLQRMQCTQRKRIKSSPESIPYTIGILFIFLHYTHLFLFGPSPWSVMPQVSGKLILALAKSLTDSTSQEFNRCPRMQWKSVKMQSQNSGVKSWVIAKHKKEELFRNGLESRMGEWRKYTAFFFSPPLKQAKPPIWTDLFQPDKLHMASELDHLPFSASSWWVSSNTLFGSILKMSTEGKAPV